MLLVPVGPVNPVVFVFLVRHRFPGRAVVGFRCNQPVFAVAALDRRKAAARRQRRFSAQQVFNPGRLVLFIECPPHRIISVGAGNSHTVRAVVALFCSVAPVVEVPFYPDVGVSRGHGLPVRIEPRFAGQVFLVPVGPVNPVILVLCMGHRFSGHAVVGFGCDQSVLAIGPLDHRKTAARRQHRLSARQVFDADCPVVFVKGIPDLVISVIPGNRLSVRSVITFRGGVPALVKVPFNPDKGIPRCHGIPVRVIPCFACDMLRVQVGPVNPVIFVLHMGHRLAVRAVIGFRGNESVLAVYALDHGHPAAHCQHRLSIRMVFDSDYPVVFVKSVPDLVISVVPGHRLPVRSVIPFRSGVSVSVKIAFNPGKGIARSHGLSVRIEPRFAGHVLLVPVCSVNPVIFVFLVHHRFPGRAVVGFRCNQPVFAVAALDHRKAAARRQHRFPAQQVFNPGRFVLFVECPPYRVISVGAGNGRVVRPVVAFFCSVAPVVEIPFNPDVGVSRGHGFSVCVKPRFAGDMLCVHVRPVDPVILVLRMGHRLAGCAVVGFRGNESVLAVYALDHGHPAAHCQHRLSIRMVFDSDYPVVFVKSVPDLVISVVPDCSLAVLVVGQLVNSVSVLIKLTLYFDIGIPVCDRLPPGIKPCFAGHVLRVHVGLFDPVVPVLRMRRGLALRVQVPFCYHVPVFVVGPLHDGNAVNVFLQFSVREVSFLYHAALVVVDRADFLISVQPFNGISLRVKGLHGHRVSPVVKNPFNACIGVAGDRGFPFRVKPGFARHMLAVPEVGFVYPVVFGFAVDCRLSVHVKIGSAQDESFVIVLAGEAVIPFRQRRLPAVRGIVSFPAERILLVIFPLDHGISGRQVHRLSVLVVIAFLCHLPGRVCHLFHAGVSGRQVHHLAVCPVILRSGSPCAAFLRFFADFPFFRVGGHLRSRLLLFRFPVCVCFVFFVLFRFDAVQQAQILQQQDLRVCVFLPRGQHQLAFRVVIAYAHLAALAVIFGFHSCAAVSDG